MIRSLVLPLLALSSAPSVPIGAQCETQKFHPEVDGSRFAALEVEGDLAVCRTQDRFVLYERTPLGWMPGQELPPSGGLPFAGGAALDGDRLVVSGFGGADGSVSVYERSAPGQPFALTAELQPSVAPVFSAYTVLALEGDVLAVGMPEWVIDPGQGLVFVFEHASGAWIETFHDAGQIIPFAGGEGLGYDVEVDAGVVFARGIGIDPVGPAFIEPAVHVYAKGAGGWSDVQVLDQGESGLGISADGGRLATLSGDGTVRIFAPIGGAWTETTSFATLPGANGIALDGTHLAVGDGNADLSGYSSGAVETFEELAGSWSPKGVLLASDPSSGAYFGENVALDGDTLLVSATGDSDAGTDKGAVYAFSLSGQGCPSLTGDLYGIDSAVGGTQTLSLAPGAAFAGDLYVMAGSLSGFSPGTPFAGQTIPLNLDLYLEYTLFHGGSPPLSAPFGFLDGAGEATVLVALPADPNLAGLKAHHAYGVADPALNLVHVSNPVPLLVP